MMEANSNVVMHPAEQKRQLRKRMAQAVEMLIAAIDEIDADPDFEDTGDEEPSLGGADDDRELDHSDNEPSLGWTASGATGGDEDLEQEHDGREPEVDEMDGDEQDYMLGADDEHGSLGGMLNNICYGMGTAFVRNDGALG